MVLVSRVIWYAGAVLLGSVAVLSATEGDWTSCALFAALAVGAAWYGSSTHRGCIREDEPRDQRPPGRRP